MKRTLAMILLLSMIFINYSCSDDDDNTQEGTVEVDVKNINSSDRPDFQYAIFSLDNTGYGCAIYESSSLVFTKKNYITLNVGNYIIRSNYTYDIIAFQIQKGKTVQIVFDENGSPKM